MSDHSNNYSIRELLLENNPGSRISPCGHEWLLHVQNSCVKLPRKYCFQIGDCIYDNDAESKICRIIVENRY